MPRVGQTPAPLQRAGAPTESHAQSCGADTDATPQWAGVPGKTTCCALVACVAGGSAARARRSAARGAHALAFGSTTCGPRRGSATSASDPGLLPRLVTHGTRRSQGAPQAVAPSDTVLVSGSAQASGVRRRSLLPAAHHRITDRVQQQQAVAITRTGRGGGKRAPACAGSQPRGT